MNERIDYAKYKALAQKYLMATAIYIMQQPENLYYGYLLSELKKVQNYQIKAFKIMISVKGIQLQYNPVFVVRTYEGVGEEALQLMLMVQLNHLTLLHLEAAPVLQAKVEGLKDPKSLTLVALEESAKAYLPKQPDIPCPRCKPTKWDKKNDDVYGNMLLDMDGHNGEIFNDKCPLCNGGNTLFNIQDWASSDENDVRVLARNMSANKNVLRSLKHIASAPQEAREALLSYAYTQGLTLPDKEADISSAVAQSIAKSTVTHVLASKGMSASGNAVLSAFTEKIKPKSVPFLLQLKGMMSSSMGSIKQQTRYRPNRRFGYKYPGKKSTPKMRYIAAVDTSGSVSAKEVAEVIGEMQALRQYSNEVECRMLLFHHSVWADMDVADFDIKDFESKFQSGGTDFDNVFKRVFKGSKNEKQQDTQLNGHNINVSAERNVMLVMLTDGYASIKYPKDEINGRVVWVLTQGGSKSYIQNWDANAEILEMN